MHAPTPPDGSPLFVLGISAFYHDSAACLTSDGEIIAAAQEERFSRRKHDPRFPANAINYCLEEAQLEASDLAAVVFYDNPALSLDRIMHTLLRAGDSGEQMWLRGAPAWMTAKLFVNRLIRRHLGADVAVLFSEHHFSHAASAFYPSPFRRAAVITIDGVGEWATTTIGVGDGDDLQILKEIHFPHSMGLLYSAFTHYCGFKVNSGEYKLMGLAPYGKPVYAEIIRDKLVRVKPDGSFQLNLEYFGFTNSMRMINARFEALFGGPPRQPESRITRREMDLAASVQLVTEEIMFGLARHARELTGASNLCLAGGVALNCVANGKLLRSGLFERIWIQPAAGDAGGSLGCALMATHRYFGKARPAVDPLRDAQRGSYLGPAFDNTEVQAYLDYREYPYERVSDDQRATTVAEALAAGKIVGYMVGRMEFGPRSLGARSILGDPRNAATQSAMNLRIKYRESFRPFAPAVLRSRCADYFEIDADSPYMLLVAPVRPEIRRPVEPIEGDDMIPVVNQVRSSVPAITHVDYSARVQTVDPADKPDFARVLAEFDRLTGCAVVVNTSFNVRGEPIVCSPEDCYRCFMRTEMEMLILGNFVLYKDRQPEWKEPGDWRKEYELD